MSAICGILHCDGAKVAPRAVERMLASMNYRTPDRRGVWCNGPVGLGHGLMRITHEDQHDAQPLQDKAAGLVLVADLRLDNREVLAAALGTDHLKLRDMPDSALLMAAYKQWGEECADHLVGDFAFAVWDQKADKLMLVRDHMGQRGIHFHHGTGFLAFATDIRALLTLADVPRVLSEATIARRLMGVIDWPTGATHLKDIHCLGGGRTLTVVGGKVSERQYWVPHANPAHENRDEAYYIATYRAVLEEAVACRLRRLLRPAALAMSGGFDSAAISGLAGPVVNARNRKLVAVSAVMPEGKAPSDDPRPWVELCRRFMSHLDVRYLDGGDVSLLDNIEQAFMDADGPVGAAYYVERGMYRIARDAGARLFMDGMGGDYTVNHRGHFALAHFLRTGQWLRFAAEFRAHLRMSGRSLWRTLRRDIIDQLLPLGLLRLAWSVKRGFAPIWKDWMVTTDFAREIGSESKIDPATIYAPYASREGMRQECLAFCRRVQTYPPSAGATAAAREGLEFSRPFHDKRVVEFAMAIPEDLYVKNGRNRYLACRALADVYPPEFQTRDRRQTAGAPDFNTTVVASQPQLLGEIERLRAKPKLARYVDFSKVNSEIVRAGQPKAARLSQAANALLLARFVEWFARDNR